MKKYWARLVAMCAVLTLILPMSASAATFRASDSGVITVSESDQAKNLYVAGSSINVEGPVLGDFVGAGQTISINDSVEYSVIAAGSDIQITGPVGQNVKVAGASLTIDSNVAGDVLFLGPTTRVAEEATIGGDLFGSGASLDVNGVVEGNIRVDGMGTVRINGTVKGNIEAMNLGSLEFGSNAVVEGNVTYSAQQEAVIESGALIKGTMDYSEITKSSYTANYVKDTFTVAALLSLVMTILLLLLFVYLVPKFARHYTESAFKNGWASIGIGLAVLILLPVVGLLFMVSVLGLKIGLVLTWFYVTAWVLASVFGPLLLGSWLVKALGKDKKDYRADWLTILVGTVGLAICQIIPYVGGIITFIFFIWALGTISQLIYGWIGRNHAE